jgi:hypothetical protein
MSTSGTFGFRLGPNDNQYVEIDGLKEVSRNLNRYADDLTLAKGQFKETNKEVAQIVIGEAKRFVPVSSGALATSIRDASTVKAAKVRAGGGRSQNLQTIVAGGGTVEYAGPIHFGWPARRIKPQPFFYDAIDGRRQEVAQRYVQLLEKIRFRYDL